MFAVSRAMFALSLAIAPAIAVAQAPSAAPMSVRAADGSVDGAGQLLEGDGGAFAVIGILGLIILAAYLLSDDEGSASP